MKKPIVNAVCFVISIFVISAMTVYAFFDDTTISQEENRMLTKQPEWNTENWFSGDFATNFESFLSDHVYERPEFLQIAKSMEGVLEREVDVKVVSHGVDIGVITEKDDQESEDGQQSAQGEPPAGSEAEQQDYLVLTDRVLSLFTYNADSSKYYWETANALFENIPDSIHKYLLLAPSRIAFEEEQYKQYSDDQAAAIQEIYDNVDGLVTKVDAYRALEEHADEELFFRTDHHWTHLGAYYAAQALFEAAGREYTPIEEYDKREGEQFLGYLYAQNSSETLAKHPDDLIYYVHENTIGEEVVYVPNESGGVDKVETVVIDPSRAGYYTFVESSYSYAIVEGKAKDNSCILAIGDSYVSALTPWLSENYGKVIVIDPRYYNEGKAGLESLIQGEGVTDFILVDFSGVIGYNYFTSQIAQLLE